MGKIFDLITQCQNPTTRLFNFRVNDGYCPLPDLPPGKTRNFKLSKIVRCCRQLGHSDWTIDVLVDGVFTGMQLKPKQHVLRYARIVFKMETNGDGLEVACIDGIPENLSDFFFRHKYFGWMRNYVWDQRRCEQISRADSKLAKKLRDLELPVQDLDPFPDAIKRQNPSAEKKGGNNTNTKNTTDSDSDSESESESETPPHEKPASFHRTAAAQPPPHDQKSSSFHRTAAAQPPPHDQKSSSFHRTAAAQPPPYEKLTSFDRTAAAQPPPHGKPSSFDRTAATQPPPHGKPSSFHRTAATQPPPHGMPSSFHRTAAAQPPPHEKPSSFDRTAATQPPPHGKPSSFDRTAAGARRSPDPMVKNRSDHIGSHRPIIRDENYMDSFVHGLLFIVALAMVSLGALYI